MYKDFRKGEKPGERKHPAFDLVITFTESLSCALLIRVFYLMLMRE